MGGDTKRESRRSGVDRRTVLQTAGVTVAGAGVTGVASGSRSDPELELVFEDQVTDGTEITIARVATDIDAFVVIGEDSPGDVVGDPQRRLYLEAGDVVEDVALTPEDPPLAAGEYELTARLQESNGSASLERTATVTVEDPPERIEGFDREFVEADPGSGFEYPYFLAAPDVLVADGDEPDARPILVEPTNTGAVDDDLEVHREAGERIHDSGMGLAERIGVPFLVPVFPRPRHEPVDGTHYTHALDDTTMAIDGGSLERIDLQLLRMVEDAQERLRNRGHPIRDGEDDVIMNGFSASGNFVDRFVHLHPDRVLSVTAGGLNGMPLLPVEDVDGTELPFHVGLADVPDLTGDPVDLDAIDDVNQFLYMGAEDTNDTIPYSDAWTDDDLRQLALEVYGDDMVNERFVRSQELFREAGVDAQFRVYEGAGHTPRPAYDDIVAFHQRSIEGKDVGEFGQNLIPEVSFSATPDEPTVGTDMTFNASDSEPRRREFINYSWDFDDGETAVGETTTHSFVTDGEYTVELTVIFDDGEQRTITDSVTIAAADDEGSADESDAVDGTADDTVGDGDESDGESGDGVPGFGVVATLASLGGAGYLLNRRIDGDDPS